MSKTALAFYRKSQDLAALERERPKNIGTVRQAILEALGGIEGKLKNVEASYYEGMKQEEYMRKVLYDIRICMKDFTVTYIHASYQIDEILLRSVDPPEHIHVTPESVKALKEYDRKLLEIIPANFQNIMEDINHLLVFVEKYCLSFVDGMKKDSYLETAYHYEMRQDDYRKAIHWHMENIVNMGKAYRAPSGLGAKFFGLATNELARRLDCGNLPLVLVFPEACHNIRNACKGIEKWLQADAEYTEYIQHDIIQLGEKKQDHGKQVREVQEKGFQLEFQLHKTKKEAAQLLKDLKKLQPKEKIMNKEKEKVEKDLKFVKLDIDFKEQERNQLKQLSKEKPEASEEVDLISADIVGLRVSLPQYHRQIEEVKEKMSLITEKKESVYEKQQYIKQCQHSLELNKTEVVLAEKELNRIARCLEHLKKIHHCRTSNDLTKKIFHNMPVEARNSRMFPRKDKSGPVRKALAYIDVTDSEEEEMNLDPEDLLEKAMIVTARYIEGDWMKLYRNLPFYPARGEHNLTRDLDDIIKNNYRKTILYKARDSLERWRRLHIRANVREIKEVLEKINRKDVNEKMELSFQRKLKKRKVERVKWRRVKNV